MHESGSNSHIGDVNFLYLTDVAYRILLAIDLLTTEVYSDWFNHLSDRATKARIQMRVRRLTLGNPRQHRNLTGGVSELKIDFGPGYRVYYTMRGKELIILLAGGDKSSQDRDIETAIRLAAQL